MRHPMDRRPGQEPDDAELETLTSFALRLADAAGRCILPHFRSPISVDNKGDINHYDPVTVADRDAESAMRRMIASEFPGHGIYGEEHGYLAGSGAMTWVIDPLDGTRAFITGALHWGTLIALYNGERPILGVMDQPYTRERFIGSRRGAFWRRDGDQRLLHVRDCRALAEAVLYTTSPALFADQRERAAFEELSTRVRLTRYGGDCYSYCMLASGYVDLVVESDLKPYDVQALIPIIEAAGGVVTTWNGEPAHHGGSVVAASTPALHRAARSVLQPS